ncbi:MAG: T9SS type A sorting domain-containing protein, partial [Kangiellaceae bacterium]|nr:T9SS type A sorting domain-containing protein [Kangiellaceae bacterium]
NWSTFDLTPYIYVKEVKYDVEDPNILYASGGLNGLHDTVYFLQSIDAGDTWNVIHREMPGSGNVGRVLDFEIIDGGIIYVTDLGGLYYLESIIETTTDEIKKQKAIINLFPNPTRDILFVSSDKVIETLTLFDGSGKTIIQRSIKTTPYTLQLDNLKEGTYYLRIRINDQDYLRKVIKH